MDNRIIALRASEVALAVAAWLLLSALLISARAILTPLGVAFPSWPVILANSIGGVVAMLFASARAWNHQPANLAWANVGIAAVMMGLPIAAQAPGWLILHNLVVGAILLVASAVSAIEASGAITEAPALDWGGHPVFTSAMPGEDRWREQDERDELHHVGMKAPDTDEDR